LSAWNRGIVYWILSQQDRVEELVPQSLREQIAETLEKMKIVAQQGEDRFLISLGGDMGQILDLGSKVLFPPFLYSFYYCSRILGGL
jgi:hypothetical protein